jgi:hypothetical protein
LYDRQAAGALTGRLHGLAEHLDQFQIQCRGEKRDVRRGGRWLKSAGNARKTLAIEK